MIDLHIHVLPGLDDGARDDAESLAMLRLAVADGATVVCATPHAHGPDLDTPPKKASAALSRMRETLRREGIDLDLRLASEVWYRPDLDRLAREGRLVPYAAGPRPFVLVEFPPTHVPIDAEETLFRLRLEGVTPVIAHPERNPTFQSDPGRLERFRQQGALAQVTAGALTGMWRREARACAMTLLDRGAIDFIASDAHRTEGRAPGLSEAARIVAKRAGPSEADRLTVGVPAALLAGAPPPGAIA